MSEATDKAKTFDILADTNIYDLSGLMLTPAAVSLLLAELAEPETDDGE